MEMIKKQVVILDLAQDQALKGKVMVVRKGMMEILLLIAQLE